MTVNPEQPPIPEVLSPLDSGAVASLDLRPRRREDPPWSGWDVVLIVFVALLAIVLFSVGALAIASLLTLRSMSALDIARNATFVVPVQTAAYLVVVGFMYVLVRHGYHCPFWRSLGWKWPARGWAYPVGGVLLALAVELLSALLPIPKSLPIEHLFNTPSDAYLMAAFGITAAPLVEELFFRGFLYAVLARRLGVIAGVLLTSFAFALIHASQLAHAWGPVLLLFVVGLVLTIARARTRSVAASFLVHVGYNLALFVMLYISTDRFQHLEKMLR